MYLNEELFIDFLSCKELTWIGIDFSKATFTQEGFDFPQEVIQHYFNDWNMLIISDQKKYDIRLSFRKPLMQYDLSLVKKLNKSVKLNRLLGDFIDISDIYSEEDIRNYIRGLAFPKQSKYELMFVVESFDAKTKMGSVWVVIVHAETNETVLCEKFLKTPGGFGVRNYWARVFYNLLFDIRKYSFLRWENLIKTKLMS
ncbi:MAG: hypothetical protein RR356_06650 [Bacteroidales bacterium]